MHRYTSVLHACVCKDSETIKSYLQSFKVPALQYLNIVRPVHCSSKSKTMATTILKNSNLRQKHFSSILNAPMAASNGKEKEKAIDVLFKKYRAEEII